MFYNKRKSYTGRWFVKLIEAALIFGIIFFGLDAIGQLIQPVPPAYVVREVTIPHSSSAVEAVIEAPQLGAVDYFHLALDHQTANDYYDAVIDYTRAINLDPSIAASWLNRGVAYEQLRNGYRAMYDFQQYMERTGIVTRSLPERNSDELTLMMDYNLRYDIPLTLRAGDVVSLSAVSSSINQVDPIIVLVNEAGFPVAANDDVLRADGSLIVMDSYINNFTVTDGGAYTLHVSHAGGGYYGEVTVNMEVKN